MDGIHDLGGMHGFGPVTVEAAEPVFHSLWEGRVAAMTSLLLSLGLGNTDAFRHAIERMGPVAYLSAGYYGRWLAAAETLLAEGGFVTREEIERRLRGELAAAPAAPSIKPRDGRALRRIDAAPRFAVGQAVRARNMHPSGHTRLPRYARGKRGVIARVHPAWVFPDTNAHGLGENPQYAYAVRFEARELWGADAEPGTAVHVDLFETYLDAEPAAASRRRKR